VCNPNIQEDSPHLAYYYTNSKHILANIYNSMLLPYLNPRPHSEPITITIDWVRHGESCANYSSHNFMDKDVYPDRPVGYEHLSESDKSSLKKGSWDFWKRFGFTSLKSAFMYHPNLSFIGAQHAILLGTDYLKSRRLDQRSYDIIFCSPSLRTIMTALFALRGTKTKIVVCPYILEHLNLAGSADKVNPPVKSDVLIQYVEIAKTWIEHNWIDNFDDIEVMSLVDKIHLIGKQNQINGIDLVVSDIKECAKRKSCVGGMIKTIRDLCQKMDELLDPSDGVSREPLRLLMELTDRSVLRGPEVDFSYIKAFESNQADFDRIDIDKFYKKVLMPFVNANPSIKSFNILCITHGATMRTFFHKRYPAYGEPSASLRNTQVYQEKIYLNGTTGVEKTDIDYEAFVPALIRSDYENFEKLNRNVCSFESLQGIIVNIPIERLKISSHSKDTDYYYDKYIKYKSLLQQLSAKQSIK